MSTTLHPRDTAARRPWRQHVQRRATSRAARVGSAILAGGLLWASGALAAPPPDSFADLAKRVTPAVVNIASKHKVTESAQAMPDLPF